MGFEQLQTTSIKCFYHDPQRDGVGEEPNGRGRARR